MKIFPSISKKSDPKTNYQLLDNEINGMDVIKLTSKPYTGILYTYGVVRLIEESEQLRIQFEFDVHENPTKVDTTTQDFRNYIGDILVELLDEGVIKNNITYTGGV